MNHKQYFRDADAILAHDADRNEDELVLAITDNFSMVMWPDLEGPLHNLLVHRFDPNTGALITDASEAYLLHPNPSSCPGASIPNGTEMIDPGLRGCALRPDGHGVYLTGEKTLDCINWVPFMAHVEFGTGQYTDLSYAFPEPFDPNWTRTRIYRNRTLDNTGNAIYFPGQNTVGALTGLSDLGNMTFSETAITNVSVPTWIPPSNPGSDYYLPSFLNIGIAGDKYLSTDNRAACCTFLATHGEGVVDGHYADGAVTWNGTNNPFNSTTNTLTFNCDVIIPENATINALHMEWRFAPDARIIIERGGQLIAFQSKLTSIQCPNERWPGVQLEGQTHASNSPLNLQGYFRLATSTLENAIVGVRTGRFDQPLGPALSTAHYGGRVIATNSTIKNCLVGALVERHHANTLWGGQEQPNMSKFISCQFITDMDWPGGVPQNHLRLSDVRHVTVNNCSFTNDAPWLFPPDQTGTGVYLNSARTSILGNGNPTTNYFRNLRNGVVNVGGPFNPVQVDRMHFENNVYGILDLGSTFVNYSRNTFHVADQGANPNPRTGMLLWQTKRMIVEQNIFTGENRGGSVGIHFVSIIPNLNAPTWTYADEKIYNNTFSNLAAGELVKGVHRGNAANNLEAGLQLLCGDHTNNIFDIALLDQSLLKPNQGGYTLPGSNTQQLAGNQFFDNENCTSRYDWAIDANWNNIPGWYQDMQLNYKRHEQPVAVVGVTCDGHPDFWDFEVAGSGPFDKNEHCDAGEIPLDPGGINDRATAYQLAKDQLSSALDMYNGTVDLGNTPDLRTAIRQTDPLLSSSYLRDLLMTKHPLSDEILALLLNRAQPLDNWHLTQVLLQNSRLNPGIWNTVQKENLLPPYFMGMVAQAQQGQGPTTKQLLEQEISQRHMEMAFHMTVLGQLYGMDTLNTSSLDSLRRMTEFDKDPQLTVETMEALLANGEFSKADSLLGTQWDERNGQEAYADLLAMQQDVQGEWEMLNTMDRDKLYYHAQEGGAGAAMAAGILMSISVEPPLPPVYFPNFTKNVSASEQPREYDALATLDLTSFPNPASVETFVTYPRDLDGGELIVHDAQGRLVHRITLDHQGILPLDVSHYAAGLYNLSVAGTDLSHKLVVRP